MAKMKLHGDESAELLRFALSMRESIKYEMNKSYGILAIDDDNFEYGHFGTSHGCRCSGEVRGLKKFTMRKTSKAWLTKLLAGAGGLLAAGLSLGYSLYEQREAEIIPQVEVLTPVEAGRWKVSIISSTIPVTAPNGARISSGKKAIAVDMMLENISAESSNLYGELIKLANVPDTSKPQFYLKRDRAILWDMQPRMPEAVTAVWEVSADLALPDVLKLWIEGARFKPRDNLYAAPGWFPSGSVAEMRLPLNVAVSGAAP